MVIGKHSFECPEFSRVRSKQHSLNELRRYSCDTHKISLVIFEVLVFVIRSNGHAHNGLRRNSCDSHEFTMTWSPRSPVPWPGIPSSSSSDRNAPAPLFSRIQFHPLGVTATRRTRSRRSSVWRRSIPAAASLRSVRDQRARWHTGRRSANRCHTRIMLIERSPLQS